MVYKIPDGHVVYAIGDVHGRLDLLKSLHEKIRVDAQERDFFRKVIVYLGDYIDRGSDSRGVIDYLSENPMEDEFVCVYLKGNHEKAMVDFLEGDFEETELWLTHGGQACLMSYGLTASHVNLSYKELNRVVSPCVPEGHKEFLKGLKTFCWVGQEYLFVHAGIHPEKPFEEQTEKDFTSIRSEFLKFSGEFPFRVVFGHNIHDNPLVMKDRLGVDTGAYATGKLTAAVLYGEQTEFLQT